MSVEVDATVSTQVAVGGNWGAARGLDDVRTTRTLDECRNWLEAQRLKERRIKAKFRPRRKKKEPLSSNS